jgi:hypothetical protein
MPKSFKPAGYNSVSPYLVVSNASATIDFLQKPVKKEDDDRRSGVKEGGGSTWWIATRVGGAA